MEQFLSRVRDAMIAYDAGDPKRIHHFLKVHAFARAIAQGEALEEPDRLILEAAALVHDIGIHRAEALYGSSAGKYQEELGPAEAAGLLARLDCPAEASARICWLVGHHHTYGDIRGLDYQILVEADFLVNLYEDGLAADAQRAAYQRIFRTETGRRLCRQLYPAVEA